MAATGKAKTTKKAATTKKNAKKTTKKPRIPVHPQNPFRPNSAYWHGMNLLCHMSKSKKPVKRKELAERLAKLTGKDLQHAKYDLAVVLSPKQDGRTHRSARKAADVYFIEPLENGLVMLNLRA